MVFSSLTFIFRFLPVFLAVYYILPNQYKNVCLFLGSIFFYAFGEPVYVFLILCSLLFNYALASLMDQTRQKRLRTFLLLLSLFTNLGLLFFFKYTDFFLENINALHGIFFHTSKPLFSLLKTGLPLGISFYTFQILSYSIDVYKKKYSSEKNILSLGIYLCMFPQLIAGPILTYPQLNNQIKKRSFSCSAFEYGLQLFILGLGSKVILANRIGLLWHQLQTIGFDSLTMPIAWLGAFAYSFQLYFDFYGYSLMAIGLGKMLGFTIPENFQHPYLSLSFTDFFRRWHITLGKWFREYLYIPLGGNKKGIGKTILNLLFIWFLTGFWHGASWNFIIWGMSVGLLIVGEKFLWGRFLKCSKFLAVPYMIILVPISWILFAITDFSDLSTYLGCLFSFSCSNSLLGMKDFFAYLETYGTILICCFLCSTYMPDRLFHLYRKKLAGILALTAVFWLSIYYLANSINNPFLYFRF